ncbi:MAG: rRNA pseudouridine synthase [Puniceicoccales bacterium]|jgi:23S rRNA pseudouridine2605 synthase|nr:rRNA pseudouridine synthase [Puniceicoccales bacterium]
MRLQKFLALQITNSRRKAEELIVSGIVSVNGEIAAIGTCIDPETDVVAVNGIRVSNKAAIYKKQPLILIMNKPSGCVCSHADTYNPETIFDFIPKEFSKKKLMFCGRLDKETEGMIIITDDGDIAQKLTHPSYGIKKHYEVLISQPLPDKVIRQLIKGIEDNGEFLKFDKIISIGRGCMKNFVFEIVLSQGKKNEIHRAFEHFGMFVKKLKRIRIGHLSLRGLALGKCRKLTDLEIKTLLSDKTHP